MGQRCCVAAPEAGSWGQGGKARTASPGGVSEEGAWGLAVRHLHSDWSMSALQPQTCRVPGTALGS